MKTSTVDDWSPIIEAKSVEEYGRRKSIRILGVEEEPDEDVFATVISAAEKGGVTITANDVSTCHRQLGGGKGPTFLIAKFVRRDTKHQLMERKQSLKEASIYLNVDLTPLRGSITRDLRVKDEVPGVVTANKNIIVFMQNYQKLVSDNLHKF